MRIACGVCCHVGEKNDKDEEDVEEGNGEKE